MAEAADDDDVDEGGRRGRGVGGKRCTMARVMCRRSGSSESLLDDDDDEGDDEDAG